MYAVNSLGKEQKKMIVATDNLSKEYDGVYRVQELDIRIKEGDIYGFLGPNGAGCTAMSDW